MSEKKQPETKKSPAELDDQDLDGVAGGLTKASSGPLLDGTFKKTAEK